MKAVRRFLDANELRMPRHTIPPTSAIARL
jgi:hypothetical protein